MINPKFIAKIKNSEKEITGYYCPHHFDHGLKPAIIEVSEKVIIHNEIELETLRPAEDN